MHTLQEISFVTLFGAALLYVYSAIVLRIRRFVSKELHKLLIPNSEIKYDIEDLYRGIKITKLVLAVLLWAIWLSFGAMVFNM